MSAETWRLVLADGAVRAVEVTLVDGVWQAWADGPGVAGGSRKSARRAAIQLAQNAQWPLAEVRGPGEATCAEMLARVAPSSVGATVEGLRARAEASLRNDGIGEDDGGAVCLVFDLVNGAWLAFLGDADATNVHTEGEACATPEAAIASLDSALKTEAPDVG